MQVKRFIAKDAHSALRMVREAMGSEAVIITNRKVDDGIEIVASGDYDGAVQGLNSKAEMHADLPAVAEVDGVSQSTQIDGMRSEIHALKDMMESQLSAMKVGHWGQRDKLSAELFRQLSRLGLGVELATRLVSVTQDCNDMNSASRKALTLLARKLKTTDDDILEEGGVVVLLGPTGAGKTTTIAKLAAQFSLLHGTHDIVLVSADNRRIGAHEQLLAFGKLLGIPVLHARDERELDAILQTLVDKKLVLVDSAGLDQADLRRPDKLIGMHSINEKLQHYLVLPATMQRAALDRVFSAMEGIQIHGCILTKVDEAIALGDAFTSLLRYKMPLAYWTDGQRIQDDLHQARAADLVSKSVKLAKIRQENKDDRLMLAMLNTASQSTGLRH